MWRSTIGNIIVAAFLLYFVILNVKEFYVAGELGYLLIAANQSAYVLFYVLREHAKATSTSMLIQLVMLRRPPW